MTNLIFYFANQEKKTQFNIILNSDKVIEGEDFDKIKTTLKEIFKEDILYKTQLKKRNA